MNRVEKIFLTIPILLLITGVFFIVKGISFKNDRNANKELVKETVKEVEIAKERVQKDSHTYKENQEVINSNLSNDILEIYKEKYNSDNIDGVIIVGDGIIAEPVIIDHNQQYLRHMPDNSYAIEGTVIVTDKDKQSLLDNYCVYYGHGMENGTRFGNLMEKNRNIDKIKNLNLYTESTVKSMKLFQISTVLESDFESINLNNFEGLYNYINNDEINKVVNYTNNEVDIDEKSFILSLSTCELDNGLHRVIAIYVE